jgi:molecular chaperone GrpE (heat shock protein)
MERFNNRYKRDMKTAVEFLFGKIKKELGFTSIELEKIFEQAKEMEKEQIIEAYTKGVQMEAEDFRPEEYYNETFKSE